MASPVAAFSLSAIIVPGYSGPLVQLMADAAGPTQDFKLSGGVLVTDDVNEDTIAEWLAANSATTAFVEHVKNQCGGAHAVRAGSFTQIAEDSGSGGLYGLNCLSNGNSKFVASEAIDPDEPITLSAWCKADTRSTNSIIYVGESSNEHGILLRASSSSIWALSQDASNAQAVADGYSSDGTWIHVIGEFSAANARRIIVDGVERGTSATSKTVGGGSPVITIGSRSGGDQYFDGLVDSLLVFQDTLASEEITNWASSRSFAPSTGSNGPRIGTNLIDGGLGRTLIT